MKPNIKAVFQFIGKFAKGAAKSVPFVAPIIDGLELATKKDIVTGEPKDHNKLVWMAEMIGLVALLSFLVYKNIIPSDILMKIIKAIIDSI